MVFSALSLILLAISHVRYKTFHYHVVAALVFTLFLSRTCYCLLLLLVARSVRVCVAVEFLHFLVQRFGFFFFNFRQWNVEQCEHAVYFATLTNGFYRYANICFNIIFQRSLWYRCACVGWLVEYAECWNDNSIDNTKVLFKIVQNRSKNVLAGRWRLIQYAHCGRIIQFSNGTLELIMFVNGQYAQNYLQFIICKRIHFSKGDFRRFYMVCFFYLFVFSHFAGLLSYILSVLFLSFPFIFLSLSLSIKLWFSCYQKPSIFLLNKKEFCWLNTHIFHRTFSLIQIQKPFWLLSHFHINVNWA